MESLDTMTATLPAEFVANGRNLAGEKEIIHAYILIADNKETARAVCYMGKSRNASVVYGSVWLSSSPGAPGCAGHGKAGGYGYHKCSAAIDQAFASAGVKLSQDISGRGESAIRAALEAVGRTQGHTSMNIVEI